MGRAKKHWSYSAGERGRNRVRVYEDANSRSILMEVHEDGRRVRTTLGHRDRDRAKREADQAAAAFDQAEPLQQEEEVLRLGPLFEMYLGEVTPQKSPGKQKHDRRASKMFTRFFGKGRVVATLSRQDWDRFIAARSRGSIFDRGPVGPRTVAYDLKHLRAVLTWATQTRGNGGSFLLDMDPLRGLKSPKEPSPSRPSISEAEYRALCEVAGEIHEMFRLALVLAYETGHRIGAIRKLRHSDIDWRSRRITWRADHDKQGREHRTPLSQLAVIALRGHRLGSPNLGDGWLFPSPEDPSRPCSRHLMRDWWRRGEELAGLERVHGRGWHALRRRFATDLRLRLPLRDLCDAGGWRDADTVLKCYQQPDEGLIRLALDDRSGRDSKASRQDDRQERSA